MRQGLEIAGWRNAGSSDISPEAIAVHRMCFGDGEVCDIGDVKPAELPLFDALVSGFPCQPFSSSGPRLGLLHPSGNVFENIARVAEYVKPRFIILENVRGLLNHQSGSTFASVLQTLTGLGYFVEWMLLDLAWLGVPHTRPRVFIVAHKTNTRGLDRGVHVAWNIMSAEGSIFSPLVRKLALQCTDESELALSRFTEKTRTQHCEFNGFGEMGFAIGDKVRTWHARRSTPVIPEISLGALVAPEFSFPEEVRSIRFYARGKGTKLHVRSTRMAHCVGNIPGSAPMFCVPLQVVNVNRERLAFLRDSNWHREDSGYLVMRMAPESAVRLFGPGTDRLAKAISMSTMTLSKKYILVANLVAPRAAAEVAGLVSALASP